MAYIWFNTEGFAVLQTSGNIIFDSSVFKITGDLDIDTGWTGTFTTPDGKTVTVSTGIITNVSPGAITPLEAAFGVGEFGTIGFG